MEDLILIELRKKLKWKEKFFVKLFKGTSIKIYKIGIETGVNAVL